MSLFLLTHIFNILNKMKYCYIVQYSQDNPFFKYDILSFIKDDLKAYTPVFENVYKLAENFYIANFVDIVEEEDVGYYRFKFNSKEDIYINEYNMILTSNEKQSFEQIKKKIFDYPIILFTN